MKTKGETNPDLKKEHNVSSFAKPLLSNLLYYIKLAYL